MKHLVILLFISVGFIACTNNNQYEIESTDKYRKQKESIEEMEKKSPKRFLKITGNSKKNLLGQTVVKATIVNTATIAVFKDFDVKMTFYSKTKAELEEDRETIYETLTPGSSKSFKLKFFTPKGTDSVGFRVMGAKY